MLITGLSLRMKKIFLDDANLPTRQLKVLPLGSGENLLLGWHGYLKETKYQTNRNPVPDWDSLQIYEDEQPIEEVVCDSELELKILQQAVETQQAIAITSLNIIEPLKVIERLECIKKLKEKQYVEIIIQDNLYYYKAL